jgi:hypothetical protein
LCASHHLEAHGKPPRLKRSKLPPGITKRHGRFIVTGRWPDGKLEHLGFFQTKPEAMAALGKFSVLSENFTSFGIRLP